MDIEACIIPAEGHLPGTAPYGWCLVGQLNPAVDGGCVSTIFAMEWPSCDGFPFAVMLNVVAKALGEPAPSPQRQLDVSVPHPTEARTIHQDRATMATSGTVIGTLPGHLISKFIGKGGSNVKQIQRQFGTKTTRISVDSDSGVVSVRNCERIPELQSFLIQYVQTNGNVPQALGAESSGGFSGIRGFQGGIGGTSFAGSSTSGMVASGAWSGLR